jgi:hypothetical protein
MFHGTKLLGRKTSAFPTSPLIRAVSQLLSLSPHVRLPHTTDAQIAYSPLEANSGSQTLDKVYYTLRMKPQLLKEGILDEWIS